MAFVFAALNSKGGVGKTTFLANLGGLLAAKMIPGQPAAVSVPALSSSLQAMYAKGSLSGSSSTAQDIMVQNILINLTADAAALQTAAVDDPALMMLANARTQAVGSMNLGNITAGHIAEEALPILRNLTEAILVALYPVLLALLIASDASRAVKLFVTYLYTMVWVELWSPIFAVLNWLQTFRASTKLTGAATMEGDVGLSITTATGVYGTAVSDVAMASWMVTFTPAIAAALIFGFDRIMTIAGARPGASEASRAADSVSKGNMNMGNVSFGQQQLAEMRTSPTTFHTTSAGGAVGWDLATGVVRAQHTVSSGVVDTNMVARVGDDLAVTAEKSTQLGRTMVKTAADTTNAAFGHIDDLARRGVFGAEGGRAWREATSADDVRTATKVKSFARNFAEKWGVKDFEAVEGAIRAGISGGVDFSEIPFVKMLGVKLKMDAGYSVTDKTVEQATRDFEQGLNSIINDQVDHRNAVGTRFLREQDTRIKNGHDRTASKSIAARLEESKSYRESSDASFKEADSYAESARKLRAILREMKVSGNNEFYDYAIAKGYDPHSGNHRAEEWERLLVSFTELGQLKMGEDGLEHFVLGSDRPQIMTPEQQRLYFDNYTPQGGRQAVRQQAEMNRKKVKNEQQAAGVSPTGGGGNGELIKRVDKEITGAGEKVDQQENVVNGERGKTMGNVKEGQNNSGQHQALVRKGNGPPVDPAPGKPKIPTYPGDKGDRYE